jgi:hypothetical protein
MKMTMKRGQALFLSLHVTALPLLAEAFVPSTPPLVTHANTVVFLAKKQEQQQRKKSSTAGDNQKQSVATRGGGFAPAPTTMRKKSNTRGSTDDYAIFPALEPQVKATLVTSPQDPHCDAAGELPNDIYHRLDQIYGFSQFNYEAQEAEEVEKTLSFQDLLAGNLEEDNNEPEPFSVISKLPPFDQFHVLHVDPLVLKIPSFFTAEECDAYVAMPSSMGAEMYQTGSLTVGKDAQAQAQRTSTTWFNHYRNVPALMAKASRLLGLDGIDQWEEPQTVRYRRNEKFTWHLDALGPQELMSSQGGQRTATLLVYHTDLDEQEGGATIFRDLRDKNGDRLKV